MRENEICLIIIGFIILILLFFWVPVLELVLFIFLFLWQAFIWNNIFLSIFALILEFEMTNIT